MTKEGMLAFLSDHPTMMAVRRWVPPQAEIERQRKEEAEDPWHVKQYRLFVGLVVAQGAECYKGEKFPTGPWCKTGDWITAARDEGVNAMDSLIRFIKHDRVYGLIEDPTILHDEHKDIDNEHGRVL